jgi:hypothetical protein
MKTSEVDQVDQVGIGHFQGILWYVKTSFADLEKALLEVRLKRKVDIYGIRDRKAIKPVYDNLESRLMKWLTES